MKGKKVWFDIDSATREQMAMSFAQERAGIAKLLTQIQVDMDHWNDAHPKEKPLTIVLDFSKDVVEAKLARNPRAGIRR